MFGSLRGGNRINYQTELEKRALYSLFLLSPASLSSFLHPFHFHSHFHPNQNNLLDSSSVNLSPSHLPGFILRRLTEVFKKYFNSVTNKSYRN